ncbi:hypothetical protein HAX54_020977, partial [Datura stramonium]|nr:hypothetical protein [Datura stramonium]
MSAQSEGNYAEALQNYYAAMRLEIDPYDRSYILYDIGLINTYQNGTPKELTVELYEEDSIIIRSSEPEVKILVDRVPDKTSFKEWARPVHFSRTIAKGPDTTTWIWNLHDNAHDFDSHTSDLEERKLSDPTHIGPSSQVVWPIVGQEILSGDVGGGFRGIQMTS